MDENVAKDMIIAHTCCTYGMCNYCPFCNTNKCKDISFSKDNMEMAIKSVKGIIFRKVEEL